MQFNRMLLKALFGGVLVMALGMAGSAAMGKNIGGVTRSRNGHSLYYYKHRTFKAVFEVPGNPKMWPAVVLVLTHNIASLIGHGIRTKIILVAPGPTIHFFMSKFDAANYKKILALRRMGVRMLACHAALVAFHVHVKQLFPFVGVAYPNGVTYILKKEAQGYPYYVWP